MCAAYRPRFRKISFSIQKSAFSISVSDPVARSRASPSRTIPRVCELTAIERQTPTPDALGEASLHPLEFGNAIVDAPGPAAGQLRPVGAVRRPVARQLRQLGANLFERQPDLLREHDERYPAEHAAGVAP